MTEASSEVPTPPQRGMWAKVKLAHKIAISQPQDYVVEMLGEMVTYYFEYAEGEADCVCVCFASHLETADLKAAFAVLENLGEVTETDRTVAVELLAKQKATAAN